MVSSMGFMPALIISPERATWPPAMWPHSWAMTPTSSLGSVGLLDQAGR